VKEAGTHDWIVEVFTTVNGYLASEEGDGDGVEHQPGPQLFQAK
jgi:hypothetical protein